MGFDYQSIECLGPDSDSYGKVDDPGLTVSIVVPVWGPPELTDRCLESLVWSCSNYKLVLVDNTNSYDIKTTHNLDAVYRNPENIGFSRAINQGVKGCKTDIIVMLNCDATGTLDWLDNLMAVFADPDIAIAGPRIVHPDGVLQTAGVKVWHGNGNAGGEEIKQELPTRDVDCVTGACMAVRRDVFNALGGLCEEYWLGYEDVDFCLTAREAGYRIRYVAESTVQHLESATGPERWSRSSDNVVLMNQRWGNR